jgi:sugar lactone lactonase YvrE
VANYGNSTVTKFDPSGHESSFASALNFPRGVACDNNGNVYVASVNNSQIFKFGPSGQKSVFADFSSGVASPGGLAFDPNGNLYVADFNGPILKFNSAGQGSVFASSGLNVPLGLGVDRSGSLYAVNLGNSTVEKFTPSGTPSLFANSGLNSGSFIAVQVPEPATWAMLALGICVVLGGLRLRHRSS